MCKACYHREYEKKRSADGTRRKYLADYREKNGDKFEGYYEKRRADPAKVARDEAASRKSAYKLKYGTTPAEIDRMYEEQGNACALCAKSNLTGRDFHVDHCHQTGRIRGILCQSCNTSLGKLGDTVEALERVLRYLK